MSLVVEDGSGLSTAESYISAADCDAYFSEHGDPSEWTSATTAEKEAALRYATSYLDDNYEWYSSLLTRTQALDWPRNPYLDSQGRYIEGVPQKIKDATCEMALEHLKSSLNFDDTDGIQSEKYGDASVTYRGTRKAYSPIKKMLTEFGNTGSASSNILYRA